MQNHNPPSTARHHRVGTACTPGAELAHATAVALLITNTARLRPRLSVRFQQSLPSLLDNRLALDRPALSADAIGAGTRLSRTT